MGRRCHCRLLHCRSGASMQSVLRSVDRLTHEMHDSYMLNILIGGLLTFCGFNTLASKIASFVSCPGPSLGGMSRR